MAQYRSFIFLDAIVTESSVTLEKRESHHLVKVFRARVGESVELLDGKGKRYLGSVKGLDARAAVIKVEKVVEVPAPRHQVTLLQALPKAKAMDLIIKSATEIGVAAIQPIYTSQSEVHIPEERIAGKVDKWATTTVEASKQCGLPFLPVVLPPVGMLDWLKSHPADGGELRIVASLEAGSRLLLDALAAAELPKRIVLAVGPEGDFSPREYEALSQAKFVPVRLGDNVLRAETAAAYMLSVIDQFAHSSAG